MSINNFNRFIFGLLFVLGLFARLWQFSQVPISLYWDEVAIGLDARSLLQTGKDLSGHNWLQPLFVSYGDYKAPVYIWLTTILGELLSVTELTVRLPSLLGSLATAFIFYLLLKQLYPKPSSIPKLSLVSLAAMPWAVHFSRIGMESNLSLFFLTLSVFLMVLAAKKNCPWLIIFSAFSVSFGIYTYISLRLISPALFIATFLLFHKLKLKKSWAYFVFSLSIIVTSILILINSTNYQTSQTYRLSNDNLITSTVFVDQAIALQSLNPGVLAKLSHHRYFYQALTYLQNYLSHFSADFLLFTGDPNLRHHSGFGGQLLLFQGVFLLIGLWVIVKTKFKNSTILLLIWTLLSPTVAALVNEVPHASRSIYLIISLAWLIGIGLSKLKPRWLLLAYIGLALNFGLYLHDYFIHYPSRSALAWINPYKQSALNFKDNPPIQPVYISDKLYKPELYFAFYLNDLSLFRFNQKYYYQLPATCPQETICLNY